ncbi:D-alanyl-D-alanine carboxypeptidase [Draconibacterium orientale]|uniref:D-alanyl-D-alanine carboxypeptidase n=1 Tax=Draconibacterium orientale TaxID=1168034 RepID=A0A1I0HFW1_9BACT|nr:serine hydrolase domain-containing protein [Draconibacterium orientale]SET81940.1 D-alanyl-D-alanine carboxypeptidase [Draconibacterium orientale]
MYLSIVNKSKFGVVVLFFLLAIVLQCSNNSTADIQQKTEKLFQKQLKKNNIRNAFLSVYSPSRSINWNFAAGTFQTGQKVTADHPFLTASIGKTFTATAIAQLAEQGSLNFNDPVNMYLPNSIMHGLHVFNGLDYSAEITIAHLLQHTSGLPDYFEGKTIDGSANVMELLFSEPDKLWKPVETIEFAKQKMEPLFVPGNGYNYTDTEYVLLGLIVEKMSGTNLHNYFEEHFFKPLNMNHTSMHLQSEPLEKTPKLSEAFAGDFEVSTIKSLSADWAGGGLVSTGNDLIKFQHALFSGKIISAETLQAMQNWTPETRGMEYGFGLRKIAFRKLFPTLPDLTIIGHSGSTGSFMFYCPELDVYLAGTLNQTEEVKESVVLMVKVLSFILNIS